MAADEMPAELVAEPQRAFEIELGAALPAPGGGDAQRLGGHIDGEEGTIALPAPLHDGQAGAGAGDRRADVDRSPDRSRRRSPAGANLRPALQRSSTSPKSLTIPVNTALPSFENFATILADRFAADAREARRAAQRRERHALPAHRCHRDRRLCPSGKARLRQPDRPRANAAAKIGPASTISRRDAALGKQVQHSRQIEPAVDARHGENVDARRFQRLLGAGRRLRRRYDPQRRPRARCASDASSAAAATCRRAPPAPASSRPCRAAGRSASDRRPAPCRCRSGSHRYARAAGARARAPPRR